LNPFSNYQKRAIMKKILLLTITLISLAFISCNKDDNNETKTYSVVGQWSITSQRHEKYNGTTKIGDETYTNVGIVLFNANGSFSYIDLNGTTLATGNYVYSDSGKTLNIKLSTDTNFTNGIIQEQTSNKLVFRLDMIHNPPDNGADKTVITTTITR